MCPTIDLGVDFEAMKEATKFAVVPDGDYDFQITKGELKQSSAGRPMIKWTLQVANPDDGKPVNIFYNTVLPWRDSAGELDVSGCGMLVNLCQGVGNPWTGSSIDPDSYIGLGGRARVTQRRQQMQDENGKWVPDPDGDLMNDIKKIL